MTNPDFISGLNKLFMEELEAAVRYLHLSATIKGLDRLHIRKILVENMNETLEHAQLIADKILQLGGLPKVELKVSLPPEKISGIEALKTALAFEQAALDAYRELLEKVEGKNLVLEEFLRSQVSLESEHVAELQLLID